MNVKQLRDLISKMPDDALVHSDNDELTTVDLVTRYTADESPIVTVDLGFDIDDADCE